MVIYIIGSLRNPEIPKIANRIQEAGHEAFADWYGAGPEADDKWKEYEIERGKTYLQALKSYGARAIFDFDKKHLERADACVLVSPAGKSGHMELGWAIGSGKLGYYLLDNPDRWDVMLQFATLVTDKLEDIIKDLNAKGLEQAGQEVPARRCLCGKAKQVGEPVDASDVGYYRQLRLFEGGSDTKAQGMGPIASHVRYERKDYQGTEG